MIEKPSKTFLIRGGIALTLLIIIFIFQTNIFTNLFSKKETTTQKNIESLEDLIKKDSNNNTIPDWEERFWGLDPLIESTNGRLNAEIIAERRLTLSSDTAPQSLTETERLARELFISATIVGGSTDGDLDAVRTVSERAADQFTEGKGLVDQITIDSITRKQTTKQEVSRYITDLMSALNKKPSTNEIVTMAEISEKKDFSKIKDLTPVINSYTSFSKTIATIPVPTDFAEEHLELINSINNMGRGVETFQNVEKDPLTGIIGLYQYSTEEDRYLETVISIIEKSNSYFLIP